VHDAGRYETREGEEEKEKHAGEGGFWADRRNLRALPLSAASRVKLIHSLHGDAGLRSHERTRNPQIALGSLRPTLRVSARKEKEF